MKYYELNNVLYFKRKKRITFFLTYLVFHQPPYSITPLRTSACYGGKIRMSNTMQSIPSNAHSMYTKNDTTDISFECQSSLNLSIPPWSAYQSILSKNDNFRTAIFRFPLMQGPSIDYSSIYTALKQAQNISIWTDSIKKTVVSLDLDLYFRALQLVQSRDDMKDKYVLRLGELHAVFAHLRATGTFVENSGIDDAWEQGGIFGTVVIRQILSCRVT